MIALKCAFGTTTEIVAGGVFAYALRQPNGGYAVIHGIAQADEALDSAGRDAAAGSPAYQARRGRTGLEWEEQVGDAVVSNWIGFWEAGTTGPHFGISHLDDAAYPECFAHEAMQ